MNTIKLLIHFDGMNKSDSTIFNWMFCKYCRFRKNLSKKNMQVYIEILPKGQIQLKFKLANRKKLLLIITKSNKFWVSNDGKGRMVFFYRSKYFEKKLTSLIVNTDKNTF